MQVHCNFLIGFGRVGLFMLTGRNSVSSGLRKKEKEKVVSDFNTQLSYVAKLKTTNYSLLWRLKLT